MRFPADDRTNHNRSHENSRSLSVSRSRLVRRNGVRRDWVNELRFVSCVDSEDWYSSPCHDLRPLRAVPYHYRIVQRDNFTSSFDAPDNNLGITSNYRILLPKLLSSCAVEFCLRPLQPFSFFRFTYRRQLDDDWAFLTRGGGEVTTHMGRQAAVFYSGPVLHKTLGNPQD